MNTITAVILYKGTLAHYAVTCGTDGRFEAVLLKYNGKPENEPPKSVAFEKHGRHCSGESGEQDLMDDLCDAAKDKFSESPFSGDNSGIPYVHI